MDYLKAKVDAGADYICTQLFFDNHDFYDFKERCEIAGIRVPIIAGIMPVRTKEGLKRMADLAAPQVILAAPGRLDEQHLRAELAQLALPVGGSPLQQVALVAIRAIGEFVHDAGHSDLRIVGRLSDHQGT